MTKRRDLIKGAFALPFVAPSISLRKRGEEKLKPGDFERDYFKELGLRTFINAAGTYTALTASLPHPEVIKAINYSALQFVKLEDLQDKVGERLAELLQCEFAMVTAGAASAITLGTAGIVTGGDWDKIAQIPNDMTGMKTEVIIQKTHRVGYDHAIRNCGLKVIEVESAKELEAAINNNTAMMWFLNASNFLGKVRDEEFVTIAKRHQIPTMIDCAADVPPVEMLWKHTKMGFDLVRFSGGKGLRGPQSAGLLLGKKALVTAARRNAPPNGNTVGRGMKVNKEEILGMLVAIEQYLSRDHQKDWKLWESQVNLIYDAATSVPGVIGEKHVPQIANHVPSLNIKIDQSKVNMTCDQLRIALREGHPSIETVGDASTLGIIYRTMIPGEERTVAKRIKEILLSASIK